MIINLQFNLGNLAGLEEYFRWITAPQIILTVLLLIVRVWLHRPVLRFPLGFLALINAATAVLCFQNEVRMYGIGSLNIIVGFAALVVVWGDFTNRKIRLPRRKK